ncbi:hypothetical protein LguiA_021811 [Lonicera macranthoides]
MKSYHMPDFGFGLLALKEAKARANLPVSEVPSLKFFTFLHTHHDVIRPSSSFYPIMVVRSIPNDDPHMMTNKDRAWKFKRNSI